MTMKPHCDPDKRHDFVFFFDVRDGNPNGDPDAANLPRVDPETLHGLVTDVALKRRIRDYIATVYRQPIFIQSAASLNALYFQAARRCGAPPIFVDLGEELSAPTLGKSALREVLDAFVPLERDGFSVDFEAARLGYLGEARTKRDFREVLKKHSLAHQHAELMTKLADELEGQAQRSPALEVGYRNRTRDELCRSYFDVRMFGAVLTAGFNAGQVRGPMQLGFSRSLDPIFPMQVTLTRRAVTRVDTAEGKTQSMGRKSVVPYALYRAHGFFNPYLARQTGVQRCDLEMFWSALANIFELDRSASRGEMAMRALYVFTHDAPQGNAPAHRLFELIRIDRSVPGIPRSASDYFEHLNAPRAGAMTDFPGVTLEVPVDPRA